MHLYNVFCYENVTSVCITFLKLINYIVNTFLVVVLFETNDIKACCKDFLSTGVLSFKFWPFVVCGNILILK